MKPARHVSDIPGLHGEWTLKCKSLSNLEIKTKISRRLAGALTLSRKVNDDLYLVGVGVARKCVGCRESNANLSIPRIARELNSYVAST